MNVISDGFFFSRTAKVTCWHCASIWCVTNVSIAVVCIFTEAACLKVGARTSFRPLTCYANYPPPPVTGTHLVLVAKCFFITISGKFFIHEFYVMTYSFLCYVYPTICKYFTPLMCCSKFLLQKWSLAWGMRCVIPCNVLVNVPKVICHRQVWQITPLYNFRFVALMSPLTSR